MLHTEPSFCIYTNEDTSLENEKGDSEVKTSQATGGNEFSFADTSMESIVEDVEHDKLKNVANEENNDMNNSEQIELPQSPKMYLATGFGIDVMGGVSEYKPNTFDEEYYKMMVVKDPCNPLFLKGYAQLLQSRGDLTGAEDYYSRATIQDPKDGEVMMNYGKLIWEFHRDQDRALTYFEKAVLVAPGDSNILAAYANFLWEIEQVQDEGCKDHGGIV